MLKTLFTVSIMAGVGAFSVGLGDIILGQATLFAFGLIIAGVAGVGVPILLLTRAGRQA